MTLDKTQQMNYYLDFYGALLTDKQKEVLEYYYLENYSYTEIAEILKTSRSAVYDLIKRTEAILTDYESKMQLLECYKKRMECYKKLNALNIEKVTEIVSECIETE